MKSWEKCWRRFEIVQILLGDTNYKNEKFLKEMNELKVNEYKRFKDT